MPRQDAQGRWYSDDGTEYWDGVAWRPVGTQVAVTKKPSAVAPIILYLGFTVDRDARANVLILSAKGGMDIEQVAEESPEALVRLYPNPWRGPLDFELAQLVYDAGLGE